MQKRSSHCGNCSHIVKQPKQRQILKKYRSIRFKYRCNQFHTLTINSRSQIEPKNELIREFLVFSTVCTVEDKKEAAKAKKKEKKKRFTPAGFEPGSPDLRSTALPTRPHVLTYYSCSCSKVIKSFKSFTKATSCRGRN